MFAKKTPKTIFPTPTSKDYEKTFFARYFIKKDNTDEITEVDEKQYKDIKEQMFFSGLEMEWKLVGPEFDIIDYRGTITAHGVASTNQRAIAQSEKVFKNISLFISNTIQFAKIV